MGNKPTVAVTEVLDFEEAVARSRKREETEAKRRELAHESTVATQCTELVNAFNYLLVENPHRPVKVPYMKNYEPAAVACMIKRARDKDFNKKMEEVLPSGDLWSQTFEYEHHDRW